MPATKAIQHLEKISNRPANNTPAFKRPIISTLLNGMDAKQYRADLEAFNQQKEILKARKDSANSEKWQRVEAEIARQPDDDKAKYFIEQAVSGFSVATQCEQFLSFLLFCSDRTFDLLMQLWDYKNKDTVLASFQAFDDPFISRVADILDKKFEPLTNDKQKGRMAYALIARLHAVQQSGPGEMRKIQSLLKMVDYLFIFLMKNPTSPFALMVGDYMVEHTQSDDLMERLAWRKDDAVQIISKNKNRLSKENKLVVDKTIARILKLDNIDTAVGMSRR